MKRLRSTNGGDARTSRSAFTLAEVMVALMIVALFALHALGILRRSKLVSVHTKNEKLAAELAQFTLGEVAAGLYQEELDDQRHEGGYEEIDESLDEFWFEITCGDETPTDRDDYDEFGRFDSWAEDEDDEDEEEDDEEVTEPFETVTVTVYFTQLIEEFDAQLRMEQNIPWEQVYGPQEDEEGLP